MYLETMLNVYSGPQLNLFFFTDIRYNKGDKAVRAKDYAKLALAIGGSRKQGCQSILQHRLLDGTRRL